MLVYSTSDDFREKKEPFFTARIAGLQSPGTPRPGDSTPSRLAFRSVSTDTALSAETVLAADGPLSSSITPAICGKTIRRLIAGSGHTPFAGRFTLQLQDQRCDAERSNIAVELAVGEALILGRGVTAKAVVAASETTHGIAAISKNTAALYLRTNFSDRDGSESRLGRGIRKRLGLPKVRGRS